MNYEPPTNQRPIPITISSQNLFMLEQAKYRVENDFLEQQSAASNKDNRYDAHLYDTIDQERINKNVDVACNRQKVVPNKYANKSLDVDNNIALYNTRGATSLNEQNIIGNVLPERLKNIRDNKIMTPNAWMKDYDYIKNSTINQGIGERFTNDKNKFDDYGYGLDMETGNYNGYMSQLLTSNTNKPYNNLSEPFTSMYEQPNAAFYPDMRLQQNMQTQQRQIKDENAKVLDAMNLRNSPYIKERNARQAEMTILMNHNGQMKIPMMKTQDYIDFLDEQNNKINGQAYDVSKQFKQQNNKYNIRNSGGTKHMINKGYDNKGDNKEGYKIGNINRQQNIYSDINDKVKESYKPTYKYNLTINSNINEDKKRRDKNIIDVNDSVDKREYYKQVDKQGRYIDDSEKTIYTDDKNKFYNKVSNSYGYGNEQQTNYNNIDNMPIIRDVLGEGFINKEAFCKADHILITREGEISNVYTRPNETETAPVLVSLDDNNRPLKIMATADKFNLYIFRKRDPSIVDINTGNIYGDKCDVLAIPLKNVNDNIRKKIEHHKNRHVSRFNESNKRNPTKLISFEYEDLVSMAETMNENPNKITTLHINELNNIFKTDNFDKIINDGINEDRIFTTPITIQQINQNERTTTNIDTKTIIRDKATDETIIKGQKDKYIPSIYMVDYNRDNRLNAGKDERIDKEINYNYRDIRPVNKNSFNSLQKSNIVYPTTMRTQQNTGHYYQFEK